MPQPSKKNPAHPDDHKVGAEHRPTEEQVDMEDTVPQHVDDHGTKVEDKAGTGEHDSKGG